MFTERRRERRARVLRRGKIVFRNGHSGVECVVMDLSSGGARLKVGEFLGVPEIFELRVENGAARWAELCYRNMDMTGVRFRDAAT